MKVTTIFCAAVAAFAGITKVHWAVPCEGREMLVPEMLPASVMLVGTRLAGGCGGVVGSVMSTVTVVPCAALPPGATDVFPPVVAVGITASYVARVLRVTR